MAFNLGVNVIEVDGRAAPTVAAAPVSVAAMLVRSRRGIPNKPVLVRGIGDVAANFGGPLGGYHGYHAARGFFENGGNEAYLVRISRSAVPAEATLNDLAGLPTLKIQSGVRGEPDPGQWGNGLDIRVLHHPLGTTLLPAQIVGSAKEPFELSDGEKLNVTVDNRTETIEVTFSAADFENIAAATATEVAAAINRQVTEVRAAVTTSKRLVLSKAAPSPTARVTVISSGSEPTVAKRLGFAPTGTPPAPASSDGGLADKATFVACQTTGGFGLGSAVRLQTRGHAIADSDTAGTIADGASVIVSVDGGAAEEISFADTDFDDPAAITPTELVTTINRQARSFLAFLTPGSRIALASNSYGNSSSIAITPGTTDATPALGLTNPTVVSGVNIFGELTLVDETAKIISWSAGIPGPLPTNLARIQSVEFDLAISRDQDELERFESLSMQSTSNHVATVINNESAGSRYIVVEVLSSGSAVGTNAPAEAAATLAKGSDGDTPLDLDYVGDPAARTGLYALDPHRIQLLACPETTSPGVVAASLTYCEQRGDLMFVGCPPRGYDLEGMKTYANAFRGRKVYGALYGPWIEVLNPADTTGENPRLTIPPVGHILGMYARIATRRGVWKAPAGDEATLNNALGVELDMTDADHTDLVKNGSVNGVRAVPGAGIIVDASRTLSTDTRWLYVGVRRLFNFVKASLREGLRWVAQEPHSEQLRRTVRFNVVSPFLLGLWRQGAFGSGPSEDVFTIKCDAENNPPDQVNLGNFTLEVYFYPVKPAETILVVVGQQESSAIAADS